MAFNPHRYDNASFRRCGNSGLKLPALSLGGWHNFTDRDFVRDLTVHAFDRGVTHFDFANNYGPPPGRAEQTFGKVLRKDFRAHRDELIISSKAGYLMWPGPYGEWGSKKYLIASLEQSLRRLKLDYVDIFYSHRFDPDTPLDETMGALDQIVRQGKALYAGISSYSGEQTREAYELLAVRGTKLTIHQPAYNMLNRGIEDDLLPDTARLGIGVIAFCPLAQGLLTERYLAGIPDDSRAADPDGFLQRDAVTPKLVAKMRKLADLAAERDQTLAQLAISWILRDPRITSVLCGVSKISQLDQNLAALNAPPIVGDHLHRIDAILAE